MSPPHAGSGGSEESPSARAKSPAFARLACRAYLTEIRNRGSRWAEMPAKNLPLERNAQFGWAVSNLCQARATQDRASTQHRAAQVDLYRSPPLVWNGLPITPALPALFTRKSIGPHVIYCSPIDNVGTNRDGAVMDGAKLGQRALKLTRRTRGDRDRRTRAQMPALSRARLPDRHRSRRQQSLINLPGRRLLCSRPALLRNVVARLQASNSPGMPRPTVTWPMHRMFLRGRVNDRPRRLAAPCGEGCARFRRHGCKDWRSTADPLR